MAREHSWGLSSVVQSASPVRRLTSTRGRRPATGDKLHLGANQSTASERQSAPRGSRQPPLPSSSPTRRSEARGSTPQRGWRVADYLGSGGCDLRPGVPRGTWGRLIRARKEKGAETLRGAPRERAEERGCQRRRMLAQGPPTLGRGKGGGRVNLPAARS